MYRYIFERSIKPPGPDDPGFPLANELKLGLLIHSGLLGLSLYVASCLNPASSTDESIFYLVTCLFSAPVILVFSVIALYQFLILALNGINTSPSPQH